MYWAHITCDPTNLTASMTRRVGMGGTCWSLEANICLKCIRSPPPLVSNLGIWQPSRCCFSCRTYPETMSFKAAWVHTDWAQCISETCIEPVASNGGTWWVSKKCARFRSPPLQKFLSKVDWTNERSGWCLQWNDEWFVMNVGLIVVEAYCKDRYRIPWNTDMLHLDYIPSLIRWMRNQFSQPKKSMECHWKKCS